MGEDDMKRPNSGQDTRLFGHEMVPVSSAAPAGRLEAKRCGEVP